ncbi:Efflux pump himE [Pseudocercospora fuligena]|uniref:Efflux pump himE n=1 Tax=Pseudocercospora fuligena TaxID=685502 RepID=A0A8H6RAN1_9PEZI|nr:Efflux pump himE [Pseudocercospora fuligena]
MSSDFLSLILQAVGGAWAESKTQSGENNQGGVNIMIAGLLLQAISLASFVGLWAWFQLRVLRGVPTHDPAKVYTRQRRFFYAFNVGLLVATAAIVVRSIYRVAELWGGFSGKLWNDEVDFMILDGAMIGLAVFLLTLLHPGAAFGGEHAVLYRVGIVAYMESKINRLLV